jgi:hypothetical protein
MPENTTEFGKTTEFKIRWKIVLIAPAKWRG